MHLSGKIRWRILSKEWAKTCRGKFVPDKREFQAVARTELKVRRRPVKTVHPDLSTLSHLLFSQPNRRYACRVICDDFQLQSMESLVRYLQGGTHKGSPEKQPAFAIGPQNLQNILPELC